MCQHLPRWASQLLCLHQMFVTDFFLSVFLLVFTAILMVAGIVLLVDAMRRLTLEAYKATKRKQVLAVKPVQKKADAKVPVFERAA